MNIAKTISAVSLAATVLLRMSGTLSAQAPQQVEIPTHESAIVDSSAQVVNEIMSIPGRGIPGSLLANAEGLVILPGMIKGGFVIGAKRGNGVVLVRDPIQGWQLPQFITITGGSVGWQIGVQATDLILVFVTKKSVQGLLTGAFTIGADASAAAGPLGREASASTDATLRAEIFSYSRSRGLFAGVALDGSALRMDNAATAAYYQQRTALPPGQPPPIPPSALRLIVEITKYSRPAQEAVEPATFGLPAEFGAVDTRAVQLRLANASQRLGAILDDNWKSYLALPPEVYGGPRPPTIEALAQSLSRFQAVATNPQYAPLAHRPEFVETFHLLQQMITPAGRTTLALPPPPR